MRFVSTILVNKLVCLSVCKPRHIYTFSLSPDLAFHINNREAKRELKVYNNNRLLPFCPTPTYLGVKLDRSLMFRHHLEALRKKLFLCVTLLRRLIGSGWRAGAKTLPIAAFYLVSQQLSASPVGISLFRAAWDKLNRLSTGVGRFYSSMHNCSLAFSPNCKRGASEQTADHVLIAYPIHRAPHGARGLMVFDDETQWWLNNITASI